MMFVKKMILCCPFFFSPAKAFKLQSWNYLKLRAVYILKYINMFIDYLLNTVIPKAIDTATEEEPWTSFSQYKRAYVTIDSNNKVVVILADGLHCFCKHNPYDIKKKFNADRIFDNEWKASRVVSYCCGFPKLTKDDLPENWEENFSVEAAPFTMPLMWSPA